MTIREKRTVWNEAVRAVCKEIKTWDGAIPDEMIREFMATTIERDWTYKRLGPP